MSTQTPPVCEQKKSLPFHNYCCGRQKGRTSPRMLRNSVIRVCLSVCHFVNRGEGGVVGVQDPGPSHPQTCSNLFNLNLIILGPPRYVELVHCEAQTVGKRAVGIRLKCLRVLLPPPNEVWGKVMFLHPSVSHSVHSGHQSGWYASYWNAFLLKIELNKNAFQKDAYRPQQ